MDMQDDVSTAGATSTSQHATPQEQDLGSAVGSHDQAAEVVMPGTDVSAADQLPQQSHDHAEPSSASQKQQKQTDADSARADSETQASESGSQQGEEDAWQQGKSGRKVRAVDADYSVTTAKTGRKSQAKPVKNGELQSAASNAASSVSQEGETQQQANTGVSGQPEASSSAILPPKPKPGAPKARKASQPASKDAASGVSQAQGVTPPQPPSEAPSQAASQRPAPQQPQAQGSSSRKPSVPAPSSSANLPIYKPAPAAIPLPANSAWAKKLDLQPVVASKAAPMARPTLPPSQPPSNPSAAAVIPRSAPSQAAQPSASSAAPTKTAASTVKAIPMADRPLSAGGKGKSKKKGQGQGTSQQVPVAQPSSASGQRGSAVKEVPANAKDSRPRASDSTVLTAPGLVEQPNASGGG